jgi:DNA-directed RNA polymerase subunit M/transcription elongation factor TFIIS
VSNDWAARVIEACIFATAVDALSYENANCVILRALREKEQSNEMAMLPWEFVFVHLSCSTFEFVDEDPETDRTIDQVYESLEHCPKCGSKATWEQKQTRSADEGCTVFWKCTNAKCGKTWRRY